MELETLTIWLPLIYLLIHSLLTLKTSVKRAAKLRIIGSNILISGYFVFLLWYTWNIKEAQGLFVTILLLWSPIIFFWWAYIWTKHTLNAFYPPGRTFDRFIIKWEGRILGQPSLWLSQKGSRLVTEILHICYFSYYFYTFSLGLFLHKNGRLEEFESMSFAVLFGYLVSYTFFALTPVHGPRWSLFEQGLLTNPSEQQQRGYLFTAFVNRIMFEGPAHKGGALPSSHSSTGLIFMVWACRVWDIEAAIPAVLLVLGMWLGSVYGRYHFVADIIAGAIIGLISILLADYLILGSIHCGFF